MEVITKKKAKEITKEFFKRRFPNKNLEWEMKDKGGYFDEWVIRFFSGHPESCMDEDSLGVLYRMKQEGIVK